MGSRENGPQRTGGAPAPTQFSHPLTTTFHLPDHTTSRPMCNAKARGQNSRPMWENLTGTPRETRPVCESPRDPCGPASQSRGYTSTQASGLRGGGKSTYESWLRRNFSGPLWEPTEGLHQGLGQLHTSHVKEGDFRGFGGLLRCPINSQDELSAGDEAQKCQMKHK